MKTMNGRNRILFENMLSTSYRAGIYCRLSKDDDLRGESASISNQRDMLERYCEQQGFEIVEVYQDDGYTGLNMDRPDFQRMLADARSGRINTIVTKDSSRFSRNHTEADNLLDYDFPRNGIRFIAVNDGIDTLYDNNDIIPFKNILNEMYSKDISRKVHSAYHVKAVKGKFTGCLAPLGYRKDPEDRNHLLIDNDTAWIVRRIFDYAMEGKGSNYIRRRLEKDKIPCPAWWNRQKGLRNRTTKWEKADPENGRFIWDFSAIETILENPVYYGAIASQKQHYYFKLGSIGKKMPDQWIVVENCHEPIIEKRTFDVVQEKIRRRQHPPGETRHTLFAGLLVCGECGKHLTFRKTHAKKPLDIYACATYNKFGKQHCTQHRVEYDKMNKLVLKEIRKLAKQALSDGDTVLQKLEDSTVTEMQAQRDTLRQTIVKAQSRIEVLEKMIARLYEDMISGSIDEDTFRTLMQKTQDEQKDLKKQVARDKKRLSDDEALETDTKAWLNEIGTYANIKELDPATINRLVKEIIVHETVKSRYDREITIEIHFNFRPVNGPARITESAG